MLNMFISALIAVGTIGVFFLAFARGGPLSRLFRGHSYEALASTTANSVATLKAAYDVQLIEIEHLKQEKEHLLNQINALKEAVTQVAKVDTAISLLKEAYDSNHQLLLEIKAILEAKHA